MEKMKIFLIQKNEGIFYLKKWMFLIGKIEEFFQFKKLKEFSIWKKMFSIGKIEEFFNLENWRNFLFEKISVFNWKNWGIFSI